MENQMVKDAAGTIRKEKNPFGIKVTKARKNIGNNRKQFIFEKEFNNDFYYFFRISYFYRPYNRFVFHNS